MKKIFKVLTLLTGFLTILPILLTFTVDLVYHWYLYFTIPIGVPLTLLFWVISICLKKPQAKIENQPDADGWY
jgi:hypothetical protein